MMANGAAELRRMRKMGNKLTKNKPLEKEASTWGGLRPALLRCGFVVTAALNAMLKPSGLLFPAFHEYLGCCQVFKGRPAAPATLLGNPQQAVERAWSNTHVPVTSAHLLSHAFPHHLHLGVGVPEETEWWGHEAGGGGAPARGRQWQHLAAGQDILPYHQVSALT